MRGPAWTPDGEYLVARKQDAKRAGIPPVELWMFHRLGGSGIKLTSSDKMAPRLGPSRVEGRPLHLFLGARGALQLRARHDAGALADHALRPADQRVASDHHGLWRRGASGDVARTGRTLTFLSRRDAETVLVARDLESGAERIIARHRPGRTGRIRAGRCLAGLCVHARRPVAVFVSTRARLLRSHSTAATRRRLHSARRSSSRSRLRSPGRTNRHGSGRRAHPALAESVPGRHAGSRSTRSGASGCRRLPPARQSARQGD